MKLFEDICLSLGRKFLNRKIKRINRVKTVHNFITAKNICILYDGLLTKDFKHVNKFRQYLQSFNVSTYLLGYVDAEKIPEELILLGNSDVFTRKDVDIFYRPRKALRMFFYEQRFDIILDLTNHNHFPIHYLITSSPSSFKVGRYAKEPNDYDLMIKAEKDRSLEYLIAQIEHYVSNLNVIPGGLTLKYTV